MARKPCASSTTTSNVVDHHAGALDIDGCRVSIKADRKRSEGRWPSNAVFLHREGCRLVGTRRVSTGVAVRHNVGHSTKGNITYASGSKDSEMMEDVTYAGSDGKEEVHDWECVEGCPVAELEKSGGDGVSRFFRTFL